MMSGPNEVYRAGDGDAGPSSAYETIKQAAEQWCRENYSNTHPASAVSVEVLTIDVYNGVLVCEVGCDLEDNPEPVYVYVEAIFGSPCRINNLKTRG